MRLNHSRLLRLLFALGGLLLSLYLYSLLVDNLGGFTVKHIYTQWLEIILVCYLYSLVYLLLKPSRYRVFIAATPLFLLYLLHDVFFMVYGKVFRFINFAETPELLQILPLFSAIVVVLLFLSPLLLIIHQFNTERMRTLWLSGMPLAALLLLLILKPAGFVHGFEQLASYIVKYSDAKSVENNGRLSMMLYREAQRLDAVEAVHPYLDRDTYQAQRLQQAEQLKVRMNGRNVHMVVLESFLDPRLFKKLSFSQSPVHPAFARLFQDKLGLSKSPVFGGATAQAEFEVLCGVPAFEKLSSVEFNMFSGKNAYCLPGVLSAAGYRSVASNAYKPNFFNAIAGYEGAGFDELNFPVEFYTATPSYLHAGDPGVEEYLFDQDLLEQNLDFVKQYLAKPGSAPLFNYIMTIYGHTPHILDETQRPDIISLNTPYPDDHLQRAANQFYYRTEAIARYVNALLQLDPDSLVILVSDHVPPLRNGPNTYNALAYLADHQDGMYYNRIAVIENRQVRHYANIHHYEVPDIVFNYLSQGQHCQQQACAHLGKSTPTREQRMDDYLRLMAHASE